MIDDLAMQRNIKQFKNLREKLNKLADKIKDFTPVFTQFKENYRLFVKKNFESRGKLMERENWIAYANPQDLHRVTKSGKKVGTPPRLLWKQSHGYGNKQMMETTGDLKKANINFESKISKDNMRMEVKGKNYFYFASNREKWGRKTFYTKDEDMPIQAWRILIKLAENYIEADNALGI